MEIVACGGLSDGPWTPAAWNELASRSSTNTVFQTFQWHVAWWRSYGADYQALVLAGVDGERLVGLAPFMISRAGRVSFIGDGRSDFHDVLVAEADKAPFLDAVLAFLQGRRWRSLAFTNIPDSSSTTPTILALAGRRGMPSLVQRGIVNHALVVAAEREQARAIMNKTDLRRRTNFFRRTGVLEYSQIQDGATAQRYLPVFFEQHRQRWKRRWGRSIFDGPANRRFYAELVEELLPCGWLHWSVLEFDGRPIAFHFGFDYNGVLTWYKPSFDVAVAKRSPGKVLLRHLIAFALEQGRLELDFTVGDEPFKRRYMNRTRSNSNLLLFQSRAAYRRVLVTMRARDVARRLLHRVAVAVRRLTSSGGDA